MNTLCIEQVTGASVQFQEAVFPVEEIYKQAVAEIMLWVSSWSSWTPNIERISMVLITEVFLLKYNQFASHMESQQPKWPIYVHSPSSKQSCSFFFFFFFLQLHFMLSKVLSSLISAYQSSSIVEISTSTSYLSLSLSLIVNCSFFYMLLRPYIR